MLVQFIYPVIQTNSVSMSLSQDDIDYFRNLSTEDQAKYILKLNDALEEPEITSQMLIEGALDNNYARMVVVNPFLATELSTIVNENDPLSTTLSTNDESQLTENQT